MGVRRSNRSCFFNIDRIIRDLLGLDSNAKDCSMYVWNKLHLAKGMEPIVVGGKSSASSPVQKRKNVEFYDFYSYGARLTDGTVHWVPPDFALRTDYLLETRLEESERMSVAFDGRRWFCTRKDAKLHCVLSLLVLRPELFSQGSPGQRHSLCLRAPGLVTTNPFISLNVAKRNIPAKR